LRCLTRFDWFGSFRLRLALLGYDRHVHPRTLFGGRLFGRHVGEQCVHLRLRIAGLERAELRFDLAALLFFGLDVDTPTRQLRGETDVLSLLADRQREL